MTPRTTPAELRQVGEFLPEGTQLGRHRIDVKLREGGMAILYIGAHTETGARVAIKVLRARYAREPEFVARFDREASVLGRLSDCPHVVSVHDVGSLPDGRRYLVTEFIRGVDLHDLMSELRGNDEQIAIERACRIMRDVATGLASAHERGIVHRDLKPANIMIESRGANEIGKVIDFGISTDRDASARGDDLTRTGIAIGTPEYMAPEQAAGLSTDPTVDVFAMGAILFEMLTGSTAPRGGWRMGRLPDLAIVRRGVPAELARLCRACVEPDALARPQSAAEVEAALDAIISALEATPVDVKAWAESRPSAAAGSIGRLTPEPQPSVLVRGVAATTVPGRPPAAVTVVTPTPPPVTRPDGVVVTRRSKLWIAAPVVAIVGLTVWLAWLTRDHEGPPPTAGLALDERPAMLATTLPDLGAVRDPPGIVRPAAVAPEPTAAEPSAAEPSGAESTGAEPAAAEPAAAEPAAAEPAEPKPRAKTRSRSDSGRSTPAVKPTPAASPAHESPACVKRRDDAARFQRRFDWAGVLRMTSASECWASRTERAQLRVEAMLERRQYDQCVREGRGHSAPAIVTMVKFCTKKLDTPER